MCKIEAESYSGDGDAPRGKKLIVFSSANKRIRLVGDDELLADGKMYDIVKKQTHDGQVLYYAFNDEDEDEYNAKLISLEKNDPSKNSLPGKTIKLNEEKYFARDNDNIFRLHVADVLQKGKINSGFLFYSSPLRDVLSPPPDCLMS